MEARRAMPLDDEPAAAGLRALARPAGRFGRLTEVALLPVRLERHRPKCRRAGTARPPLEASGVAFADRSVAELRNVLPIAERNGLTAYAATYLWLAMDLDAALATRDRELASAARAEGVELALA
jgi:hypothetical protein